MAQNPKYLINNLVFKNDSNISQEIVDYCFKRQLNFLDLKAVGVAPGGNRRTFTCYISPVNLDNISKLNYEESIALLDFYLQKISTEGWKLRSPYPPANLYLYFDSAAISNILNIKDKSIEDLCRLDDNIGCLYPYSEIISSYPNKTNLEHRLLFQICNSLRKKIDIDKLVGLNLSSFKVKYSEDTAETLFDPSDLIQLAKGFVKKYYEVRDNQQLQNVLHSFDEIIVSMKKMSKPEVLDLWTDSIIVRGCINCLLLNYKYQSVDLQLLQDCCDRFNSLYRIPLTKLFKRDFLISTKDIFSLKNFDNTSIVANPSMFLPFIKSLNINLKTFQSDVRKIQTEEDRILLNIFYKFFLDKFNISDRNHSIILTLLVFVYLSTSPGIFEHNEEIDFTFTIENITSHIKFQSFELLNILKPVLKSLNNGRKQRNYIRLFCSSRADLTKSLLEWLQIDPPLFRQYPIIKSSMRFDFWKGLSVNKLTDDEMISLSLLKEITDYHSDGSKSAQKFIYRKVGLQSE